jgi:Flp pilus assembly protein TadD
MDALRKAEQQKQQAAATGQAAPDASSAGLALEPLEIRPDGSVAGEPGGAATTAKSGAGPLPELPTRLEELDEQFLAHAAEAKSTARPGFARGAPAPDQAAPATSGEPAPTARGAPAAKPRAPAPLALEEESDASRAAARRLFEAKQPQKGGNRRFAIAVGLLTLIAAIGIGGYFWWQLQPRSSFIAPGTAPQPAPSPMPAPTPAPVAAPPAAPAATVASAPTLTAAAPPVQATAAPDDADEDAPPPRRAEKSIPPPQPAASRPEGPIRISAAPPKPNPLFEQAFQAFNDGRLDVAQAAWQKILQADPKNADALRGLAALAQQQQQPDRAADYYLRAIEADPKDAFALSGLIMLQGHADAQQTESRLKTLLAEQPNSPYLNFALGNFYARAARWADAQQAFFKAHTADPGNPDYLFNLAVSLDQLRQARLAVQYYNQAIAAAAQRPAGFDPAQAAARLKALQP